MTVALSGDEQKRQQDEGAIVAARKAMRDFDSDVVKGANQFYPERNNQPGGNTMQLLVKFGLMLAIFSAQSVHGQATQNDPRKVEIILVKIGQIAAPR